MYQGSCKGKDGRSTTSCTSPYADLEEPSPSEGVGEHSFLFHEEEKPWNTSATRKVREVERRRDEGKNRKEEGEFEKKNISESEKMA